MLVKSHIKSGDLASTAAQQPMDLAINGTATMDSTNFMDQDPVDMVRPHSTVYESQYGRPERLAGALGPGLNHPSNA